ncbi:hypothetical protein BV22DRAFT_1126115 [Leucogyrophana mollusca]|uniref:Uncharacterized protein n=1 Tax=Leucogyrophana mollusca TaxID=85980 RepID=A0ACB8BW00_9AGAM|nr:hypothetical protein BV22DRAFT_1126115 [Leucogyrophana mollusca]
MSDILHDPLMLDTWLAKHATELDTTEPDYSFVRLWRDAWGDESGGRTFERRTVSRDPPDVRVECATPETYWVMKSSSFAKGFFGLGVSDIFVRQDYVDLAGHMITNVVTPTRDLPVSSSDDTVRTMTSMVSPFVSRLPPTRVPPQIMVVTGSPGVGKTAFLYVLLAFRLNARQPTLFQRAPNSLLFFTEQHLYHIRDLDDVGADFLATALPPPTWCLVDSNRALPTVPPVVAELNTTVVQATSPRRVGLEWLSKTGFRHVKLYMRPWTVAELILARGLQLGGRCAAPSERDLATFAERYISSARSAYRSAAMDHGELIEDQLGLLDYKSFEGMITHAASLDALDISDDIIAFIPGPSYCDFTCTIPTRYLVRAVLRAICAGEGSDARDLYRVLVRIPKLRGAAGYLLEDIVRDAVPAGGSWRVERLATAPRGAWGHWLREDATFWLTVTTSPTCLTISPDKPTTAPGHGPPKVKYYGAGSKQLDDGYFYVPTSSIEATCDAFFYTERGRSATVFQCSDGREHDVDTRGLGFLEGLGVERVVYVGVIPPGRNTLFKMRLDVDPRLRDLVKERYVIEFPCSP